jgi:hypothetical protein
MEPGNPASSPHLARPIVDTCFVAEDSFAAVAGCSWASASSLRNAEFVLVEYLPDELPDTPLCIEDVLGILTVLGI